MFTQDLSSALAWRRKGWIFTWHDLRQSDFTLGILHEKNYDHSSLFKNFRKLGMSRKTKRRGPYFFFSVRSGGHIDLPSDHTDKLTDYLQLSKQTLNLVANWSILSNWSKFRAICQCDLVVNSIFFFFRLSFNLK